MERPRFDCQTCGACCCNTARNRRAGTREYVEVTRTDRLFTEAPHLLEALIEPDDRGVGYLRLVGDEERCVALDGALGAAVRCTIYPLRPAGCRTVEAGDEECLRARRQLRLPLYERASDDGDDDDEDEHDDVG